MYEEWHARLCAIWGGAPVAEEAGGMGRGKPLSALMLLMQKAGHLPRGKGPGPDIEEHKNHSAPHFSLCVSQPLMSCLQADGCRPSCDVRSGVDL